MAFYSIPDFAKLCGVSRQYIHQYVKRKKLIMSGDFIDDSVYENKKFMSERNIIPPVEAAKAKNEKIIETLPAPDISVPEKKKLEAPNFVPPKKNNNGFTYNELDQAKKEAEINVLNARNEKLQIEIQKLRGKSIPTDLVRNVFSVFGKEIITQYKNAASALIAEFSHKTKATPLVAAELQNRLIELANKAQNEAVEKSKIEIQNIISQTKVSNDDDDDE